MPKPGSNDHGGGPDEVLTEAQFAEEHNVSVRTAQRWREQGFGPDFIRIGPRRIGYRRGAIEAWRNKRTFTSLADEAARASAHPATAA